MTVSFYIESSCYNNKNAICSYIKFGSYDPINIKDNKDGLTYPTTIKTEHVGSWKLMINYLKIGVDKEYGLDYCCNWISYEDNDHRLLFSP